jgi:coenzyme F420-reducing hydrogenase alpha subunit
MSTRSTTIDVHHLPRIEGHGNIHVRVRDGRLAEARWDVVETPRFFEAIFRDKHYSSAHMLAARICGICSISHGLAALRATERAFGVEPPPDARSLRLLAKHAETVQSHVLHLFFLAAPDFLGVPSVLPLRDSHPAVVELALRLKGLANQICDAVAGRTTHPLTLQPGGVTTAPIPAVLTELRSGLDRALEDLAAAARLLRTFDVPAFEREAEFVSLGGGDHYPFIGGPVVSSDGVRLAEDDYLEITNEYVAGDNTTKWSRLSRESYAVGPLARVNNSFDLLHPDAQQVALELGLEPVCHNPFMAHAARLVECVHCVLEAIRILDELVDSPPGELLAPVSPQVGRGVGAVEAPRGILFHCYSYEADGRITHADAVVPTTQNNGHIHRDLPELVSAAVERGAADEEIERLCCMLVRSYDPCVSCSVH